MTEVVYLTHNNTNAHSNLPARSGLTEAAIFNLAEERQRFVRKTITGARPVMPDVTSRQGKVMAARKLWKEAKPIAHTAVAQYLETIGIEAASDGTQELRYHPAVFHEPTRRYFPAMLAKVSDLHDGFVGVHRTYLKPDGSGTPADLEGEGRRMLGDCFGSFVKLNPADGFRLVLTETVEAALIIQQSCSDMPVWAAMTLGNLKAQVPANVREIIICTEGNNRVPKVAAKIIMDAVREHLNRGVTVLLAEPLEGCTLKDMRLG